MRVYYEVPEAGDDARSRIGMMFVFSSEALFKLGAAGSGAVLDRPSRNAGTASRVAGARGFTYLCMYALLVHGQERWVTVAV